MRVLTVLLLVTASAVVHAQTPVRLPPRPLPAEPIVIDTAEEKIRVTSVKGLAHPWSLAFLPNGDVLVTERNAGRLRLIHNGRLEPQAITGVPSVYGVGLGGLMEVVLHPKFADNHFVYLSYIKDLGEKKHTPALIRARLEGMALVDVKELFVANTAFTGPAAGAGMVFGRDGHLYMLVGGGMTKSRSRAIRTPARFCAFATTVPSPRIIRSSASRDTGLRSGRSGTAT